MLKFIPFALSLLFLTCSPRTRYDEADITNRWEKDIAVFDQLNRAPQPENAILFYGSSSIRLWDNIAADMAPYPVIKRGYGGAALHDAAYFARRVLTPIDYSALVLFVGNDIWGRPHDKTPAEMERLTNEIVRTSRRHAKQAPIFLVEITHVPARAHLVDKMNAANDQLKAYAENKDYVHFIPTRDLYLKADGSVREELFREDNIHQNEAGYAIWKQRIKEVIGQTLSR